MHLGCFQIVLFTVCLWSFYSVTETRSGGLDIVIAPVRVIRGDTSVVVSDRVDSVDATTVPSVNQSVPTGDAGKGSGVFPREGSMTGVIATTMDPVVSGSVVTVNGSAVTVSGSTVTVNDSVVTVNGSATTVNGSAVTMNDSATTVNGSTVTVNGSATTVNDSTTTMNNSTTTTNNSTTTVNTTTPPRIKSTPPNTNITSPTPSARDVISTPPKNTRTTSATPSGKTASSPTKKPTTTALPYKDCISFLSPEFCGGEDRRDEFVFKYRKHNSTRRYLIVVNHHWNFTKALRFLRNTLYEEFSELYPVDFDLVNMGPSFQGDVKMVSHSLRVGGEYSYYTLHRAYTFLKGYARYNGYFLINDDAFLDPFFLQDYNLRKSWHEPTLPYMWNQYWSWNYLKNEKGVFYPQAFREAIDEVINTPVLEQRCQLKKANNQRRSLQDFFYVAAVDMPLWLQLADIFYKHRVFLEQAAATINWCVSHNKIITCNHHNWPNVKTCVHLHPIKLGDQTNQMIAMLRMTHKNMNVVPSMTWWCVCCELTITAEKCSLVKESLVLRIMF